MRIVMNKFRPWQLSLAALLVAGVLGQSAVASAQATGQELRRESVQKAIQYLLTEGQAADGSYSKQAGPAVTALVTTGLLRHGRTPSDPAVAKSLAYVQSFVQPDGGVYNPEGSHKNYETSVALICFAEANGDKRYDKLIADAEKFLKGLQWDGSEGHDVSSVNYGGAGYGKHKRPDMSNTNFLLDALKAAGVGPEDEAVKKALVFVSRSQNLESEHNATEFAGKIEDGGFYYTPAAGGSSQAGQEPNGGLRSYGSMTYAGLKSMIFAGVGPEDQRVKAAIAWLSKHYTLESNPGMGDAGLYYYFHTFAKALDAVGQPTFKSDDGQEHHWRDELIAELAKRQQPNGSWINENSRWLEGDANLVTGYALLALSYCAE